MTWDGALIRILAFLFGLIFAYWALEYDSFYSALGSMLSLWVATAE